MPRRRAGAGRGVRHCAAASWDGEGFIFLSMEDETGIANVIVTPDVYERERLTVRHKLLLVRGPLQNQDGVIHVKAAHLPSLTHTGLELCSHDFTKSSDTVSARQS